jgi:4'-phosphopantetheinyl transferase
MLRSLLAPYLGKAPGALEFEHNVYGKPALLHTAGDQPLEFNMAHSGGLALIAVAHQQGLGVDIELKRPLVNADAIAQTYFSAYERTTLRGLPVGAKTDAFYACWTRKEAYIKAIGKGLSLPLDEFDVTLAPVEPAHLLHVRDSPDEVACWTLYSLAPAPGYAGALVAEGTSHHVSCWRLSAKSGSMV